MAYYPEGKYTKPIYADGYIYDTTEIRQVEHKNYIQNLKDSNIIAKKDQEIKVLKKALELACSEIDCEYMYGVYCTDYPQYFIQQAEKELKGE